MRWDWPTAEAGMGSVGLQDRPPAEAGMDSVAMQDWPPAEAGMGPLTCHTTRDITCAACCCLSDFPHRR